MNELYVDEDGFIYGLQYNLQLLTYSTRIFFSTVFQSFLRYLIIGLCIIMYAKKFTPKNIWELFGEPGKFWVFRGSQSRTGW